VAVMTGYGGRFEEVLQEGRLMRRRGWSQRENQGCGSEGDRRRGVPVREDRLSQTPSNSFCVGGGKGYVASPPTQNQ
jgi:hypothetical protein